MFSPKSQACKFYNKGQCTKGAMCSFSHNLEKSDKIEKSEKVCTFYMKGNCTRGEMCLFKHILSPEKATVTSKPTSEVMGAAAAPIISIAPIAPIVPVVHVPGDFKPQTNWRVCQPFFKELQKGNCAVCPACLGNPPNDGKTCICCLITAPLCQDCVENQDGEMCHLCSGEFDKYVDLLFTEDNEDLHFDEDEEFEEQIAYYSNE
jgi:hypothetical protein